MDNIFNMVNGFVGKMTNLFITMVSFGVMAEVLFGSPMLGLSVIENVMDVINLLGNNGVVGLIALVILYQFIDKK
jgi:hypothetical protein|tara:strand:- start:204 stop:428 length:225 start_codon:yes stop_codon:yes gene_type:complete